MKQLRSNVIRAGLEALYFTGAHRLFRPIFAGVGSIFMLHHVRPARDAAFQPNRHLEVTPEFLRAVLAHLRSRGIDIVTMDELHRRLTERDFSRRFARFTFDDGYRDNRDFALPVMREFDAPFTVYVASDFAQGTGNLWWVALEMVIAKASSIEATIDGVADSHRYVRRFRPNTPPSNACTTGCARCPAATISPARSARFAPVMASTEAAICSDLCMSWDELKPFAGEPLVSIGAHSVTHCNSPSKPTRWQARKWRRAGRESKTSCSGPRCTSPILMATGSPPAPREFALARAAGFKTAVTTRPGMIFAESAEYPTALPRVSLNGNYQDERILPVLTSGAATAMWNGFRRVDAA